MRSWCVAGITFLWLWGIGKARSDIFPTVSLREQIYPIDTEVSYPDLIVDSDGELNKFSPVQVDIVREDLVASNSRSGTVQSKDNSATKFLKTNLSSTQTNQTNASTQLDSAQMPSNSSENSTNKENKTDIIPLSLQEAILRGEAESQELKIAIKELERARLNLEEIKLNFFPTVDLSVGFNRALTAEEDISIQNSRRLGFRDLTFAQQRAGELTNQLSFLQSQPTPDQFTDPVAFIQREQQIQAIRDALVSNQQEQSQAFNAINNSASPTTNLRADFTLSYNLFSFGRRERDIKAAQIQVDIADLAVKIIRNNLRLNISNAYYDIQDAKEQVRIEEAALKEAGRTKLDATALKEAGLGTRFDELSAAVQQGNVLQRLVRAQSQVQVAASRLAELISLPKNLIPETTDPPDRIVAPWTKDLTETLELALKNRVELLQQIQQGQFLNEQKARALADLSPNINLSASVSTVFANSDSASDAALRGLGAGYALGVNLNWNLIDWGRIRNRVAQIDKSKEVINLRLEQLQNQIQREVREAYALLQANAKNVESAKVVLSQAENALRLARLRFQAGVGTQIDTIVTESQLTQAQVNLSRATLDYNRAYAALERAIGFSISP